MKKFMMVGLVLVALISGCTSQPQPQQSQSVHIIGEREVVKVVPQEQYPSFNISCYKEPYDYNESEMKLYQVDIGFSDNLFLHEEGSRVVYHPEVEYIFIGTYNQNFKRDVDEHNIRFCQVEFQLRLNVTKFYAGNEISSYQYTEWIHFDEGILYDLERKISYNINNAFEMSVIV